MRDPHESRAPTMWLGLLIRIWARTGREEEVGRFLESIIPIVEREPGTTALFGLRFGPAQFAIFNAFPGEAARQAHMTGLAAEALFTRAAELFAEPPKVEPVDIVAAKLPG